MKKIILCINDNKFLTLITLALGVLVGIFGSATGWWAVLAGVITGGAFLALEGMRRAYNETWDYYQVKRWGLLSGMAIAFSAVGAGCASLGVNTTESLGIFAALASVLFTLATAWSLTKLAWKNYNPRDGKVNLIIWSAFLGIVGLMATGCYALILWMTGTKATDLIQDDVIIYGGGISSVLIAVFAIIYIIFLIGYLWEKTVEWAKK